MTQRAIEFRVGLFSLMSVGVFIYILYLVNSQFFERSRKVTYRTLVNNAQGIVKLTAVRTGGVMVGQVTAVKLADTQTEIEFSVDSGLRIPLGSGIAFHSRGLLGETFIEIIRAPESGQWIDPGEIIPMHQAAVDMEKMLRSAAGVAADLQQLTGHVGGALAELNIPELMQNIETMFADMSAITSELRTMIHTHKDGLNQSLTQLNQVITSFADSAGEDPLAPLHDMARTMSSTMHSMDAAVGEVQQVTRKLAAGEGTLGQLIHNDELIQDVVAISQDVKALVNPASRLTMDLKYHNELTTALSFKHHVGAVLQFRPERTYHVGLTAYPTQTTTKQVVATATDPVTQEQVVERLDETLITQEPTLRFDAQIAQRYKWAALRFGLFESLGGFALDGYFFKDRLKLSAEAYNFSTAADVRRFGRLKLFSNVFITPQFFIASGLADVTRVPVDELWWEAIRPFVGGGVQFSDNDVKNVLQLVP